MQLQITTTKMLLAAIMMIALSACEANTNVGFMQQSKNTPVDTIDPDDPDYPTPSPTPTNDPDDPPTTTDPRGYIDDPRFLYGRHEAGGVLVEAEKSLMLAQCQLDVLIQQDLRQITYQRTQRLSHCKAYLVAQEIKASYGQCVPGKQTHHKLDVLGKIVSEWATYINADCLCYSALDLKTPLSKGTLALAGKGSVCKTLAPQYEDAQLAPILEKIKTQYGF